MAPASSSPATISCGIHTSRLFEQHHRSWRGSWSAPRNPTSSTFRISSLSRTQTPDQYATVDSRGYRHCRRGSRRQKAVSRAVSRDGSQTKGHREAGLPAGVCNTRDNMIKEPLNLHSIEELRIEACIRNDKSM